MSIDRKDQRRSDEAFSKKARALFDDSVASLDGETRSQLNRRRQAALESTEGRRLALRPMAWLPAAGAAAIAAAIVLFAGNRAPVSPGATTPAADVEILLEGDDLEMLGDLEFYSWIDLGPETAAHVG